MNLNTQELSLAEHPNYEYQQQYIIYISTMIAQSNYQTLPIRLLQFIDINPSPIRNIFVREQHVYVSRQSYSDVYKISNNESLNDVVIQQVLKLQPSEYLLNIDGLIVMVKPFELRIFNNGWETHPFTTQLTSIHLAEDGTLYTFHERESVRWNISSEEKTMMRVLANHEIPYHITIDGILEGHGKKIKPNLKQQKFTICSFSQSLGYVFIGSDVGYLHIYETKYMTHVKSIRRHQAAILSIKVDPSIKNVYFSGVDSKISSIKLIDDQWILSTEARGQSHDVFGIDTYDKYVLSGGITTDLCFYERNSLGQLGQWSNKISYGLYKQIDHVNELVFVNKLTSFQIWKISELLENVELLVKYDMPGSKHIIQLKCKQQHYHSKEGIYFIMAITQYEGIGWQFSEETGLSKKFTIPNHYEMIEFYQNNSVIGIKGNVVEKINYKTGKAHQLCETKVNFVSDFLINNNHALISSKYEQRLSVINIKTRKVEARMNLSDTYGIIDFYGENSVVVNYMNSHSLHIIDESSSTQFMRLPINQFRYCGLIEPLTKKKTYWYGVGESKLVLISKFYSEGKKKIRKINIGRIGESVGPIKLKNRTYFGMVPYCLHKIQQQKAVIVKKIQ